MKNNASKTDSSSTSHPDVVLAPLAPLEAAKHRRHRSKGHISAAKIDALIAKFTHDEGWRPFRRSARRDHHSFRRTIQGNGLRTALEKAANNAQNAITALAASQSTTTKRWRICLTESPAWRLPSANSMTVHLILPEPLLHRKAVCFAGRGRSYS